MALPSYLVPFMRTRLRSLKSVTRSRHTGSGLHDVSWYESASEHSGRGLTERLAAAETELILAAVAVGRAARRGEGARLRLVAGYALREGRRGGEREDG